MSIFSNSKLNQKYYVYTDGSCSNNGRLNAKAGIGIYFGENDARNVSRRIEGKQSNNTAELSAILYTYPIIKDDIESGKHIEIISDSLYAIRCLTTYGKKCSIAQWNVDIPNKELVKKLYELYDGLPNVSFTHVMAHTGKTDMHSIGNAEADRLANEAVGAVSSVNDKIYLNVPFARKDYAKELGAKWNPSVKKWYINDNCQQKELIMKEFSMRIIKPSEQD